MFSSYQYTFVTQQCFQTIQIMTQQWFHTVNIMTQQCFQIFHSMIQQFFQIVHIMTQQNSLTLLSLKTIQISSLQCFKANDSLILRSFKTIPSLTLSCFSTMYLHLSSSWLIYSTWWFLKIIYSIGSGLWNREQAKTEIRVSLIVQKCAKGFLQ